MKRLLLIPLTLAILGTLQAAPIEREENTTLALPASLPEGSFTTENAFPGLTFRNPVGIVRAPHDDRRLYILEQEGRVMEIPDITAEQPESRVFMDLTSKTGLNGESGLLGMAFHPDYPNNQTAYVYYTVTIDGERHQRLARFSSSIFSPDGLASETPLIDQLDRASNHNGGDVHFGPDGYLYVSVGDEGGANDTYNNSRFIDKDFHAGVLRIDVDRRPENLDPNPHPGLHAGTYKIPADNPYIGITSFLGNAVDPDEVRTEFWATGLRNPWRMSFDVPTGRLILGDVGQGSREEIDIIEKGRHYGWSYREGTQRFTQGPGGSQTPAGFDPSEPIWDYGRNQGVSVTGGVVYRGDRLTELYEQYIFGDYGSGRIWALRWLPNGGVDVEQITSVSNVTAFGTDPTNGDVLMASYGGNGRILRLVRNDPVDEGAIPRKLSEAGAFADLATLTPEAGIVPFEPNVAFWSDHASKQRWFSIPDVADQMTFDEEGPWTFPEGTVWVKHFEQEMVRGDPASRRRLETRFIVKTEEEIYGLTYRWNEDESDADLVPEEGADETLTIMVDGEEVEQVWRYPSRNECRACHTAAAGFALGFGTAQLDGIFAYPNGESANQIAALHEAGYFQTAERGAATAIPLAPADAERQSLEHRVRSYLAANCSNCHQPGGPALGFWDARAHLTTEETGLINGPVINHNGNPAMRLVAPGEPENSMLLQRLIGDGVSRMPPLATHVRDEAAIDLLTQWIVDELPGKRFYADWRAMHFDEEDPLGERHRDADGDGLDNETEFLNASDPLDITDRWRPVWVLQERRWVLQYEESALTGLRIDTSNDAVNWTPGPLIFAPAESLREIVVDDAVPRRFYRFHFEER